MLHLLVQFGKIANRFWSSPLLNWKISKHDGTPYKPFQRPEQQHIGADPGPAHSVPQPTGDHWYDLFHNQRCYSYKLFISYLYLSNLYFHLSFEMIHILYTFSANIIYISHIIHLYTLVYYPYGMCLSITI